MTNKTRELRAVLARERSPVDAAYLAGEANLRAGGLTASHVSSLLRHDIAKGRVEVTVSDGRYLYSIVDQRERAIIAAIALLERSGYLVSSPT